MAALHRGRTGGMRMDDEKEGRRRGGREGEIVPVKVEIVGTALSQACVKVNEVNVKCRLLLRLTEKN